MHVGTFEIKTQRDRERKAEELILYARWHLYYKDTVRQREEAVKGADTLCMVTSLL